MRLILKTGDVTGEQKSVRSFRIDVDRPPTSVQLSLSDVEGALAFDDWPALVEKVQQNELVKRRFSEGLPFPLSAISAVVNQIQSTPTFQLFLAGVDIAERIDLASESSLENVKRRFLLIDKWMPSITGAGGLFFVPADMASQFQPRAVLELLQNNKLGEVVLENVKRYYIPYATPIGFLSKSSPKSEELWDEIRNLYYAFRHSA
jgi:hypothetical protein